MRNLTAILLLSSVLVAPAQFNVGRSLLAIPASAPGEDDPLSLPDGFIAHYDATELTGLSDTDPVATFDDLSVNANDLTQPSSGSQPTYRTAQQNSLPTVIFDGDTDRMTNAAPTGLTGNDVTFAMVVSLQSLATSGALFSLGEAAEQSLYSHLTGILTWYPVFEFASPPGYAPDTAYHIIVGRYDSATETATLWVDDFLDSSVQDVGIGNPTFDEITLGARQGNFNSFELSVGVGEWVIYADSLSDSDVEDVIIPFLNNKWNCFGDDFFLTQGGDSLLLQGGDKLLLQ